MKDHQPGGGLGRALSRLLAETIVHSKAATVEHEHDARWRANSAMMEGAEDYLRPMLRDLIGPMADDPNFPDELRPLFAKMADPDAQFGLILQVLSIPSIIFAAMFSLGEPFMQQFVNTLWQSNQTKVLPLADVADMVERTILTADEAEYHASQQGYQRAYLDLMVLNAGEPYGIEQALELLRRGLISEDEFVTVVHYSRVRNQFIPDLLALKYSTMTAGDAVELALKQIVPTSEAADFFAKGGGMVEQFDLLVAAAGNPIGPEAAVNLWAHDVISDAQLQQVIAHSRINPMFYDLAKLTHHKWLSVIQIELALKAGTVTPEDAAAWLAADGYDPQQIGPFVSAAHGAKTATHKAITEAQVIELYEAGFWTHDQASAELQQLGYDAGEVEPILAVYLQRRRLAIMQAGVTRVGKGFMAGRIDQAAASNMLDALGIDHDARDDYLALWAVEGQADYRELTMAQVGALAKEGLLSDADAVARWVAMGYSTDDADLLLAHYAGTGPAVPASTGSGTAASVPPPTTGA